MATLLGILGAGGAAPGQVVVYEGDVYPEQAGWERVQYLECERTLESGWFVQRCDLGGAPGPLGELDFYRRLNGFTGTMNFFIECRVQTWVPKALFKESGIGTAVSAASSQSGTNYHFTFTDTLVRLIRDNLLPIVFVEIGADSAHIYRLELFAQDQYSWYVDGLLLDAGTVEGPYPAPDASMIWGAEHDLYENRTRWDFIRYGRLPEAASGDYDSDLALTLLDHYFLVDCLTKDGPGIFAGPGNNAGPGCRFTDFDFDGDVDLRDFAEFQIIFLGVPCEPSCPGPQ